MRPLMDMDTIQIEVTNSCIHSCSNCTRFCGHQTPFFMSMDQVRQAVDSMVGYPNMTGIMGGEPLLHPKFEEICDYAASKIPKSQLGLWSCFPRGYEQYRDVICRTFGNLFLNDHSRSDIYHAPLLVAAKDVIKDEALMWNVIDKCWIQNAWSASINIKGAFFCEVAAARAILFDGPDGWPVEPGWWKRTPKDFVKQMEDACPNCGAALSLPRRGSTEEIDDISESNLVQLKGKSLKIRRGEYVESDLRQVFNPQEMAKYKDFEWRQHVAARYGIFQVLNDKGFNEPHLKRRFDPVKESTSLLEVLAAKHGA